MPEVEQFVMLGDALVLLSVLPAIGHNNKRMLSSSEGHAPTEITKEGDGK